MAHRLLIVATLLAATAAPASGREIRLGGARGPVGELPTQQEHAPDLFGAAAAGLRVVLSPAPQQVAEAQAANAVQGTNAAPATDHPGPLRIGFHRDVPESFQGDLLPRLDWTTTGDGALAATLLVSSPQAKSIRVALRADLPPGGTLRFFPPSGADRNVLVDPVVTREDLRFPGNPQREPLAREVPRMETTGTPAAPKPSDAEIVNEPETLWSPSVQGDVIGIEITLPSRAARQHTSLRLEKIAHRFVGTDARSHLDRDLDCSGHVDVQCRADQFRDGLEDATVRLEFEVPYGSARCTGTLMNDSDPNSFEPYILTANHCVATPEIARTVQTRWFYQRPSCGSDVVDERTATTFGGADLLVDLPSEDTSLLRLRRRMPPNVFFAGWDTTALAVFDAVVGIHHPSGVVKKYAGGTLTSFGRNWPLRTTLNGRVFLTRVGIATWTDGRTEPGSSGSGLFRDGLLIGLTSGGPRFCPENAYALFSTFESVFSQLCPYLAPQSCGAENARNLATTEATISTSPSSLTEANLDDATVTVALTNTRFTSGVTAESFTLNTDVPGLAIDDLVSTVAAGDKLATLLLSYGGADFDTARTLSVTVAAAHTTTANLTTATVSVAPGLDVTTSRTTLSLNENPGATNANVGTYTVVLDAVPTATTTVTVASADVVVAVDAAPASGNQNTLTFTAQNWNTPRTVTATAGQDDDAADESVAVTHNVAGHGNMATVTVTVTDDDTGAVLIDADPTMAALTPGPLALAEANTAPNNAKSYTVRLSATPTGSVAVAVASGDAAVATASASALTFTAQNWNTPQTVTATAAQDADALDESVTFTHTATGGGYNGTVARLRVIVSDSQRTGTDYDTDEDGLIEISSLAQLNAVRWDLDGDGTASSGNASSYSNAFPGASAGMGCPTGTGGTPACSGYELMVNLDFDTDGDGASDADDTYYNGGSGWDPLGPASTPNDTTHYNATFDGNGHTLFNLFVNRSRNNSGLFAAFGSGAKVTALGLVDARVHGGQEAVGTLVGRNLGRISAAWSTGSASGVDGVGGLVGIAEASSTIVASYSRASVACTGSGASRDAGGLAASNAGTITASYAAGAVTSITCPHGNLHGLTSGGKATASYWDLEVTPVTASGAGRGQTTRVLQAPTLATSIYASWDRVDVDGDGDPSEAPWDFGADDEYPVLSWRGMDPVLQRGDYDADDDGLIDVRDLAQLNAIRWDLDGDGAPVAANAAVYRKAFPHHRTDMGCPTSDEDLNDNDCVGYELVADLDFDTDGDGATHTDGVGDSGDAYYNGGSGFEPIGGTAIGAAIVGFDTDFKGNGHTISNLFINRGSRSDVGLFGALGGGRRIEALGLPNAYVRGNYTVGALVGAQNGTIAACYSTGRVIAASSVAGGLVGFSYSSVVPSVVASYSVAVVGRTGGHGNGHGGLLGGMLDTGGSLSASYAAGTVIGNGGAGLIGFSSGDGTRTVSNAYWDRITTGQTRSHGGVGKTTRELQTPIAYGTASTDIYSAWDDVDVDGDNVVGAAADPDDDVWAFGASNQYPVLKAANFDTALQFSLQPDSAPTFATSVRSRTYSGGVRIAAFQIPAASAGNGAISYSASGLPAGLEFDADGTGECGRARTVCGTPSTDGVFTVTITAADSDVRTLPADEGTLTFTITVATPTATISATRPSPLTEANLDDATVTVTLANTVFGSGVTRQSFTLATNVPGLTIDSVATVASGDRSATLTLSYNGMDFDTARTLSVTVAAAAHATTANLTTAAVSVSPVLDVTISRSTLSLNESAGATSANVGTYTVVLGEVPTATMTVTVRSSDVSAVAVSPSSLTFTATDWATAQTVTATAQQDDDAENESAALTHTVAGRGNVGTVTATVTDDDAGTVLVDADPATMGRDPGPLALAELNTAPNNAKSYTVRLSATPTGSVMVAVASGDVAVATASSSVLTFTTQNWGTPQTVTATAVQDGDALDESVFFTHTASGGGYNGTVGRLRVTVSDNQRSGTDYDTDEDGLIEISTLAQLNAVRWDLDGNGYVAVGDGSAYGTAFAGSLSGMGCPTGGCSGYELMADLDFDTDGDGVSHTSGASDSGDDYHNGGSGWDPIGPASTPSDTTHFNAVFDGNSHTIFNLFVNRSRNNSGLFAAFGSAAKVTALGLVDARVQNGQNAVGALAGQNLGRISAAWSTGSVSGVQGVGGLVGAAQASSTIVASYSRASVACTGTGASADAGGLAASNAGTVTASYATGAVTSTTCASDNLHGLTSGGTATASYWDTQASGVAASGGGSGLATSTMQGPVSAAGVYADWARIDLDGDGDPSEAPWNFGTANEYPALRWRGMDPVLQRGDYDADDDGLIEVRALAQLNAIRWDLDGDGAPSSSAALYRKAFRNHRADMGCPTSDADSDANDCTGYELDANLDFDTDGDGSTHTAGAGDSDDAYHNGGAGFEPIGNDSGNRFSADFNGNGHTLSNLFISRSARSDTALFGALDTGQRIEGLGLPDAYVLGNNWVGALVGSQYGTIAASYATGQVSGAAGSRMTGGLVGFADGPIVAAYSTATVSGSRDVGGLVGRLSRRGSISASYATGAVSQITISGGLSGYRLPGSTVSASYWDTTSSRQAHSYGGGGKTTQELQAPTAYGASRTDIYSTWDDVDVDGDGTTGVAADADDDAWAFGASYQYPVLKFAGFDAAAQLAAQPDIAPVFGAAVEDRAYRNGRPIAAFQIPAASGGNGAISYSASGLPQGLSFDADGTGACSRARAICGTPGTNGSTTVTVAATDGDPNTQTSDQATLTFEITVATPTATISATNPSSLSETNLDNATVTVTLTGTTFVGGVTTASFMLATDVQGLSIGAVATVASGDTSATLTLDYDGTDFDTARTLAATVRAAAHALVGDLATSAVAVTPGVGVRVSPPGLSVHEDPAAGGATNANQGNYSLVLESQPPGNVTVTATSADAAVRVDTDSTPLTTTLTFTTTDWGTAQTVTVAAQPDDDAADESVSVTHAVAGYPGVTAAATVTVAVDDDETAAVVIDADPSTPATDDSGPLRLEEDHATNASKPYTVRLSAPPTATVTVTVTSSDPGAVAVGDTDGDGMNGVQNTLTFTASDWNTRQTVTLTAQADDNGVDETATVTNAASTASPSEYSNLSAMFTANVADDETPGFVFDADPATPAMDDAGPLELVEDDAADASKPYTVRLAAQPTQDVTVTIASDETTAVTVADTDGTTPGDQNTLTFTTTNWSTAQTVTLAAVADDDGSNESVSVTHSASTATNSEYASVAADLTATVDDDETRGVSLSVSSLLMPEGSSTQYVVTLDTQPNGGDVTVTITGAGDGIAVDTSSTVGIQTTLTFTTENWTWARQVTVSTAEDDNGGNESATLTHTPTGADYDGVAAPEIEVTAADDDRPSLLVDPTQLDVDENDSATYAVRLNTEPTGAVTVTVSGASGAVTVDTAEASGNQDTLTFSTTNWATDQTVTVAAGDDGNAVNETPTLSHTASGGDYGSLPAGARPGVQVTVGDDDTAGILLDAKPATPNMDEAGPLELNELSTSMNNSASYTVRLSSEPTEDTTVTIASDSASVTVNDTDGIAPNVQNTLTFTASNWNTPQMVTLTAAQDDNAVAESAIITHTATTTPSSEYTNLMATITANTTDDETPGFLFDANPNTPATDDAGPLQLAELSSSSANSASYTVRLSAQPTQTVTATIASGDTTAALVNDTDGIAPNVQNTLTFTAVNWNTPQTVTLTAQQDDGGADESVTITHTAATTPNSEYTNISADFTATVDDDETPAITLSSSVLSVLEENSADYTVQLATPPEDGSVTVSITGAADGITVNRTLLTFASSNWNTARTVRVTAANDPNGSNEMVTLTHAASGGEYDGVEEDLEVTATDNDAPSLLVSPTRLDLDEDDDGAYTIRLNTQPTGDVTVTISGVSGAVTVDTNPATGNQNTLTFTQTTWSTLQTVTVAAGDDGNAVDEMLTLSHMASGGGYGSLAAGSRPSVQLTVDDDDTAGILIDADLNTPNDQSGPLALNELSTASNNSVSYTVRLSSEPTQDATVTIASNDAAVTVGDTDGDSLNGVQNTLTFTAANWNTPRTVTLTAAEDDNGVGESAAIAHTSATATSSEYANLSATLTANTTDDDAPSFVFDADPDTANDQSGPLALDELSSSTTNSDDYTVRLYTLPTRPVTVTIASNTPSVTVDTAPASGDQNTLTFTATNWNTPQTVTLTAQQDDNGFDESATITHRGRTTPNSEYTNVNGTFTASVTDDETPAIVLSASTLTVPEENSATYTVRLATEPVGGNATVTITGAADGIAANPTRLVFTARNWNTARQVLVTAANDNDSTNEVVTLSHAASGADYGGVPAAEIVVTATDDDTPSLRVSPTRLPVRENGSASYTLRLNTQPSASVTVSVSGTTAEVTVDADPDATGDQTAMTFDATNWNANRTVTVSAADDGNATDETVNLQHAATGGDYTGLALGSRPGVEVSVDDDDTPTLLIDADPDAANDQPGPLALNEMSGHADNAKPYTVRLATEPTAQVEVAVSSGDRAVSVDTDVTPRTRTLTFTTINWAMAQTVTAQAAEDDDASNEPRVAISHTATGGDYENVSAQLFASTVDDDEPAIVVAASSLVASGIAEGTTAAYTVRLDTEPDGVARVSVAATGPVSVDLDRHQAGVQPWLRFDATNWNTPRTAQVRGLDDADAASGTATLRHTSSGADYGRAAAVDVQFAVTDDDLPEVLADATTVDVNERSTAAYSVTLAAAPTGGTVEVTPTSSDEAVATVSPPTLRFTSSNWNAPQRVTVRGVSDGAASITHAATGADYGAAPTPTVAASVRDEDAPGVRVEPPLLRLAEGGSGSYRIRLNTQPSGDVTVTATSGSSELTLRGAQNVGTLTLTFTTQNWNADQEARAQSIVDDDADDDSTMVAHSVAGYGGVSSAPTLSVEVEDDGAPGLAFAPAEGLSLTEGGAATGTYTAVLTAQPSGTVTVTVSSDDAGLAFDTDGSPGDQTMLAFTTTNWNEARTVTARAVPDGDAATEEAVLLHTAAGGGYDGVVAEYDVQVSDAEAAPAPARVTVSSAGATSLAVEWSASLRAQGYWVQWRPVGGEWRLDRMIEVPGGGSTGGGALRVATGALSVRIDGLREGVVYEVRVRGLNRGDPGDPSATASGTPRMGSAGGNRAPVVAATPEIVLLSVGGQTVLDLSGMFREPDGDALSYSAVSTAPEVASATVEGSLLRIFGGRPGNAAIVVTAEDPQGLSARLDVRVGVIGTACSTVPAQAPEGGTAVVVAELVSAVEDSTTLRWHVARDADPATADADDGDHGGASGEVEIAGGERCAEIEIPILDDAEAEPAREWFDVQMRLRYNRDARLARTTVPVAVLEGVCDRAPAVRGALIAATDAGSCEKPAPADLRLVRTLDLAGTALGALATEDVGGLSGLRTLDLSGNGLAGLPALPEATRLEHLLLGGNALEAVPLGALPAPERLRSLALSDNALSELPTDAFAAVPGLRSLRLDGNRLRTLPEGLFAGLGSLRLLRLDGNPGSPFALPVYVERTDAEPWAASPATLRAAMPVGAPFAAVIALVAEGGAFAAGATESETIVPAGETASAPFSVDSTTGFARVSLTVPQLPARQCLNGPCWQGFALRAGEPLALFARAPRVLAAPEPEALFGEGLRVALSSLAVAGEPGGELEWRVRSSDHALATVRVLGSVLLVEPAPGAEGVVLIEATATDRHGQTATVRFEVRVEFHWSTSPIRGWRRVILNGER